MVIVGLNVPAGMDSPRMTTQDAMVKHFSQNFVLARSCVKVFIKPSAYDYPIPFSFRLIFCQVCLHKI